MGESQSARRRSGGLREAGIVRGRPVRLTLDGQQIKAFAGGSVAASLLAAGHRSLRDSQRGRQPRGAFCWMGLCRECIMVIDGTLQPACRVACRDALVVIPETIG